MSGKDELFSHMKAGAATTCRAWSVVRKDGTRYGFTDHDCDLTFEGQIFKASSGMTAGALQQSSGLSVDNTEVMGALSDNSISEADIAAGRFDSAKVVTYLVNWTNVEQRSIRFRGTFGEIEYSEGSFKVELRSQTDAFNQSNGRVYQPDCPAFLGDSECKFDTNQPEFVLETAIKSVGSAGSYFLASHPLYVDRWFERGLAVILSGSAKGLEAIVKFDQEINGLRRIELWTDFGMRPQTGDEIRVIAGCNKLAATCRAKFNNFLNFRGFPNIPSADWITSYPVSSQVNDGGSRSK